MILPTVNSEPPKFYLNIRLYNSVPFSILISQVNISQYTFKKVILLSHITYTLTTFLISSQSLLYLFIAPLLLCLLQKIRPPRDIHQCDLTRLNKIQQDHEQTLKSMLDQATQKHERGPKSRQKTQSETVLHIPNNSQNHAIQP